MLFRWLMLCSALSISAAVALAGERTTKAPAALRLEPLPTGLQSAGCSFTQAGVAMPVLVVDYLSDVAPDVPTARIQVDGHEQALAPVGAATRAPYEYRNADYSVIARDFVETGPYCAGNECEGSYYEAILEVSDGMRTTTVKVRAHCGA